MISPATSKLLARLCAFLAAGLALVAHTLDPSHAVAVKWVLTGGLLVTTFATLVLQPAIAKGDAAPAVPPVVVLAILVLFGMTACSGLQALAWTCTGFALIVGGAFVFALARLVFDATRTRRRARLHVEKHAHDRFEPTGDNPKGATSALATDDTPPEITAKVIERSHVAPAPPKRRTKCTGIGLALVAFGVLAASPVHAQTTLSREATLVEAMAANDAIDVPVELANEGLDVAGILTACLAVALLGALAFAAPSPRNRLLFALAVVPLHGCASPFIAARQTLLAVEVASKGATDAVNAADATSLKSIADQVRGACAATPGPACSSSTREQLLGQYLPKFEAAVKALRTLHDALAVAEVGVSVAELQASGAKPGPILAALVPAARAVLDALRALGIAPAVLAAIGGAL